MRFTLLGITQGLTEFLPVSSSGHLYILKSILNLEESFLSFFVFLHLATLFAIFIFLRKEILGVLFKRRVLIQIGIITLITFIFGFVIDRYLSIFFGSKYLIFFCLLINGIILLRLRMDSGARGLDEITLKDSFFLGILQGLAVFPGISRSGITISGLINNGFKPKEAFSLSFLMAIPAIIGAFLFKFNELVNSGIDSLSMTTGFITAFFSGLIALVVVKKTVVNRKFKNFGYYCIIISVLILFI